MSSPTPGRGPGQTRRNWASAGSGWEPLEPRPSSEPPEHESGWDQPRPGQGWQQPEPGPGWDQREPGQGWDRPEPLAGWDQQEPGQGWQQPERGPAWDGQQEPGRAWEPARPGPGWQPPQGGWQEPEPPPQWDQPQPDPQWQPPQPDHPQWQPPLGQPQPDHPQWQSPQPDQPQSQPQGQPPQWEPPQWEPPQWEPSRAGWQPADGGAGWEPGRGPGYSFPSYPPAGAPPAAPTGPIPLTPMENPTGVIPAAVPAPPGTEPGAGPGTDAGAGSGAAPAAAPADGSQTSDSGLMRASKVMAIGTLASRGTGFLRTMMMAYALGALGLADAYNNANTLPNIVFDLVLGGIITSVFVPLLVSAGRRFRDGGLAYDQRTFTLVVSVLFVVTFVATLAAGPLVDAYAHSLSGATRSLTITFARFFIPQVFFYGVASVAGAILNARGHFAAPMWTPLVNNVVVIAVMGLFLAVAGPNVSPAKITTPQVQLLGLGTTLGLAAQVAAMVPAMRSIGFRLRFRLDFRPGELTEMGRMSGWLMVYTLTTAVSYLITMNLANQAQTRAQAPGPAHVGYGAGFTVWNNGWLLFQLPYAIIGFSIITALLPRMSGHAGEGRYDEVRRDFSGGVRLASVIIAPIALGMAVLAAPLAALLLGHGSTSVASATYMGEVLAIFSVGLLPYMLFQLLLRIFYAMHDSRTAAMIGVAVMVVNVAAAFAASLLLPPGHVTAGLAGAFGVGNVAGTAIAWWILVGRTGGLDGHRIFSSLLRMHLAAVPGLIFAIAAAFGVGVLVHPGTVNGFLTVAVGGLGGLLLYALFARALGVREVSALWETVTQRLRR